MFLSLLALALIDTEIYAFVQTDKRRNDETYMEYAFFLIYDLIT